MRKSNFDKFPATKVNNGWIRKGWSEILSALNFVNGNEILAIDFYTGVLEEQVIEQFSTLKPALLISTRDLMKTEKEVLQMTNRYMTDDELFGYMANYELEDFFDLNLVANARKLISETEGKVIVIGIGAAFVLGKLDGLDGHNKSALLQKKSILVYTDMARWETRQRFRSHTVKAVGIDNHLESENSQYKRGYFIDWKMLDRYKDKLYQKIDYWLDTNTMSSPKLINKETFFKGIDITAHKPFRVMPFFDPAPWGGQWLKDVCNLDRSKSNYGWCFDCVPEENSLLLDVEGSLFEMPSQNLILLRSKEVLGGPVEARFGKEFPIRFDLLDTIGGGNLSLQVHPTTQFVHENFGIHYTQDESYYLLDAKEDATVYLGLQNGVNSDDMLADLRKAERGELIFDAEKYANKLPAKKHDHFLIPGGTVHCSGSGSMVLEISATPNLFTFKLWDWQRLGLDGKPRPINVERGSKVIQWNRNTDFVKRELWNHVEDINEGDGWRQERTGLHENEFIETRRHWFTKKTPHNTNNGVNVFNFVEGDEAIIESPTNAFEPFTVHYAETFIIPACVGEYTITPVVKNVSKVRGAQEIKNSSEVQDETIPIHGTIKAYVRV